MRAGSSASILEIVMHRVPVNKHRSAKKFKKQISRTKEMNIKTAPMRGGIRL